MKEIHHEYIIVPLNNPGVVFGSFNVLWHAYQWWNAIETRRSIQCKLVHRSNMKTPHSDG